MVWFAGGALCNTVGEKRLWQRVKKGGDIP